MAVGMLLMGESVTRETYERLTEALFGHYPMRAEDAPPGLIMHSAGDSEGGFYLYDIWESQETAQSFLTDRVGPIVRSNLGEDAPAPTPQFFQSETLVEARTAAAA
jgi:hypothetical protein